MLAGMVITIREGLEAFLVIGILLGYLRKTDQRGLAPYVWAGTGGGIAVSIILALAFQFTAFHFEEGSGGPLFEVAASVLAVPILSYMVLWMQRQARSIKGEIETRAAAAISTGQLFALAFLAFITVFREGLETAVFLSALTTRASREGLLPGAALGLLIAIGIAYIYFALTVKLNLRRFFIGTGTLLIFIAAGLCSHIFMALHELGLPVLIEQVWSTKWLVDSESLAGRLLHAFIGYHDEPNLLQVLAYFGYLGGMGYAFFKAVRESATTHAQPSAREISLRV
ncbi:MAG: FTR1 family protein [Gemmatimonadetes bacterium]|nr:FTR1 family protein [Gemmatimonadota bacterium]